MTRIILFWKHFHDSPSPIIQETVNLSKTSHEEDHYLQFTTGLSKITEVLGETNDFSASTVQRKSALNTILENIKVVFQSNKVKPRQTKALLNFKRTTRP